jgi:aspartyl-tRNA(Asn)/glutamyl-tRNA(Gln) amidotransferase subunit B
MSETKVKIGLEIHSYLNTKSKLFCSCSTNVINKEPNSVCCPICLGHPGAKPVLNKEAVEKGVKVGLALNCDINKDFFFSRKTYFYPDSASNYQITQYEVPVAKNGYLKIGEKRVGITRAHLEIDPAALSHPEGMESSSHVLIDYNRSGLPLIEIVTEPDMTSAEEAREFLKTLENNLNFLGVLLKDTTLKVDLNISINGGERVEIKNVSGFANARNALDYEIARQVKLLEDGEKLVQHTRAYNDETGVTTLLRTKETEEDYGYIFDPDLTKIEISDDELNRIKESMPELPAKKIKRFINEYNLSEYDAKVICGSKELSDLFDELVKKDADPKISAKILTREILSILNHDSLSFDEVEIEVNKLFDLVELIREGKVNDKNVKNSLINYISGDKTSPVEYLEINNLLVDESIDIDGIIDKVLEANESATSDYKSGNEKVLNFLAGMIMRETKGSAKIDEVMKKLKEKLSG